MTSKNQRPIWAPRIPKGLLRRLYEYDASGICDEELIDKVGFGLYSRCLSFVQAVEAFHGNATCPFCGTKIHHPQKKDFILHGPNCDWE